MPYSLPPHPGRESEGSNMPVESTEKADLSEPKGAGKWANIYGAVAFVPSRCRYDPDTPFEFSMGLNFLFAFAACFTVANLYYNHPILNILARDFGVTEYESSYIPTLAQAGYASGLLFLCPLGDLLKRRPFVLWLVWFTATAWIGLCVTSSFPVFCALSYITSVTTVTPQLMLPLVAELAPLHRRATVLSIVSSGMLLGMLVARLLSGVVAQFIGWRYIYWISFALQYLIVVLLWLFMPDYPATNPTSSWPSVMQKYPSLLFSILKMLSRHPVLVSASLLGLLTSGIFTSFWTTLTFLLSSPPYGYTSLVIGLFALIGICAMAWGPLFARLFIDKHHPLLSVIIGELICLAGTVVGTYTGKFTVVGPIIQALGIDMGVQTAQIANRTAIYAVEPKGRNRVNTAYMVCVFCGQLMGTAVGNRLYEQGGWVRSGSASVGFICTALLISVLRGPHETGWIGWKGGWRMTKGLPLAVTEKSGSPDVEHSAGSQSDHSKVQGPCDGQQQQEVRRSDDAAASRTSEPESSSPPQKLPTSAPTRSE